MSDDLVDRLRSEAAFAAPFRSIQLTQAADEIAALQARVAELEAERDEELRFDLVRFENGQFDFRGGPVPAIANYFAQMFDAGEGKYFNHMEIEFDHPEAGPMVLSAQRRNGETPNQQRLAAQARAEAAEALLSEAAKALMNIERIYYMEATKPDPTTVRRMAARMNGVANDVLTSLTIESETIARIVAQVKEDRG
jgi:hypothetical protein